ncbi:MAG TPA: PQQ-binding-like beta-propeller repeat protein [Verrucomicrobiae bacterium]|jgi:outer membrane protein assembly factor BamB|nr:PQQ-binding-like beta-propeller repeat protein [Verrucomicrobiae bacterium]
MKFSAKIIVSSLATVCAASLFAQDWPQWRGANRDGKVVGFEAPKTWPKELAQKWKVEVGSGDATPALVGDKLFVFSRQGDEEVLRCLDAATGKENWAAKYAAEAVKGPDSGHGGPRSSPVVASGKVITLGVTGILSCYDAANGKLVWQKNDFQGQWPRFHAAMSPIVVDGLCIAQLGKETEGAIVAYDVGSGDQKWKWTQEGPDYGSPVLMSIGDSRMIVTETAKSIVGIGAGNGKLLWQAPYAPSGMAHNATTPIVDGQTLILCAQGRGARALKIDKQGDSFAATELWSNSENSVQFNTPVLKNGMLFGLSQKGNFFCINAQNGKTEWSDPQGGRGGFGSIVNAGPVLVALTSKGQLTAFEASDKQYNELANIKVSEKQTYAYPVLAGNRLFVKDQDSIALMTLN